MKKFTDTAGKVFAVSTAAISYLKDASSDNHGTVTAATAIYVGAISFTVAQSIDDVIAALNA